MSMPLVGGQEWSAQTRTTPVFNFQSKWYTKKFQLLSVGIKIIQRNVKTWNTVRTWSWFKLFGRVKPMLKQGKQAEEMEALQAKIKEVEESLSKEEQARKESEEANAKLQSEKAVSQPISNLRQLSAGWMTIFYRTCWLNWKAKKLFWPTTRSVLKSCSPKRLIWKNKWRTQVTVWSIKKNATRNWCVTRRKWKLKCKV